MRPVGTTDLGLPKGSIQFKVDCQTLADITNGTTPLWNDYYKLIRTRIVNTVAGIGSQEGMPLKNQVGPIDWRPQSFNKMEDASANEAMDTDDSLKWQSCGRTSWPNKHIMVFSDGGFRSKRKKARHKASEALKVEQCKSSLMAEAIVLEEASRFASC